MKHIKRFNESNDDLKLVDEIKEIVKECFIDYITDYGMVIQFLDGYYVPGYHFMSDRFLSDLRRKYPKESKKFDGDHPKCIKVDFLNEGIGRIEGSRLNIYLDENSQKLFDESIHNLRHQLKLITLGFQLMDVPEKLSPDFFGINFFIIYE
jgi:hypothetical protein